MQLHCCWKRIVKLRFHRRTAAFYHSKLIWIKIFELFGNNFLKQNNNRTFLSCLQGLSISQHRTTQNTCQIFGASDRLKLQYFFYGECARFFRHSVLGSMQIAHFFFFFNKFYTNYLIIKQKKSSKRISKDPTQNKLIEHKSMQFFCSTTFNQQISKKRTK